MTTLPIPKDMQGLSVETLKPSTLLASWLKDHKIRTLSDAKALFLRGCPDAPAEVFVGELSYRMQRIILPSLRPDPPPSRVRGEANPAADQITIPEHARGWSVHRFILSAELTALFRVAAVELLGELDGLSCQKLVARGPFGPAPRLALGLQKFLGHIEAGLTPDHPESSFLAGPRLFVTPEAAWGVELSRLPLSMGLQGMLQRAGFFRLGDLHGSLIRDFSLLPGCGEGTVSHLRQLATRAASGELNGFAALPATGVYYPPPSHILPPTREIMRVPPSLAAEPIQAFVHSRRLAVALTATKLKSLGDLHGRPFAKLKRHREFGKRTLAALVHMLSLLRTLAGTPRLEELRNGRFVEISIPAAARSIKLVQLPLSRRLARILQRRRFRRLGDLRGIRPDDFRQFKEGGENIVREVSQLRDRAAAGEFSPMESPDQPFNTHSLLAWLDQSIAQLLPRAQEILQRRFGAEEARVTPAPEVAKRFFTSSARIWRTEAAALHQLRKAGGHKLLISLRSLATQCAPPLAPLTPQLLAERATGDFSRFRYASFFYVRLLNKLQPAIRIQPTAAPSWPPEAVALLGKIPDQEVAQRLGYSLYQVRVRRCQEGLEAPDSKLRRWTESENAALRKLSNGEAVVQLKRSLESIRTQRLNAGIPDPRPALPRWTAAEEKVLGTKPDWQIARQIGRRRTAVAARRRALGIPPCQGKRIPLRRSAGL